jgi:hypothetical protein
MNATRFTTDTRPILSTEARKGGGLLSGLLQAIFPSKGKAAQRAEPTLGAARATEERREPYFGPRGATPGTAD